MCKLRHSINFDLLQREKRENGEEEMERNERVAFLKTVSTFESCQLFLTMYVLHLEWD